jgi:transposase
MSKLRFVGLDVHAETIVVAVAETAGEVRSLGGIPNRLESIRKLVHKLGPVQHLRACYEAGPTGYVLYWQLTQLGVECAVIAPSLVPTKASDRVKTDRRDAEKLARCHRAGELTAVWVPDAARSGQERSIEGAPSAGKIPVATRPAAAGGSQSLD